MIKTLLLTCIFCGKAPLFDDRLICEYYEMVAHRTCLEDWNRRMVKGEEHLLGVIPGRDFSGYQASLPTPTWAELIFLMNNEDISLAEIIFIGLNAYNTTGELDGRPCIVDKQSILRAPLGGTPGHPTVDLETAQEQAMLGAFTPIFIERVCPQGWVPEHITGIVVRKIR